MAIDYTPDIQPPLISAALDATPSKDEYWEDGMPDAGIPFTRLKCMCGGTTFQVFHTGDYETSARCEGCGGWMVVHGG